MSQGVPFLSERAEAMHREHARMIELRYSVMEKSIPQLKNIKGRDIREISRQKLNKRDMSDAVQLLGETLAHRLYFSSYRRSSEPLRASADLDRYFIAELQNSLYRSAMTQIYGYVCISARRGALIIDSAQSGAELFLRGEPVLLLDVCEHAYFLDFGFDRESYVLAAISHLDLSRLCRE